MVQIKRDMITRELHVMPFKEPESYLNIKIAWESWLEEAERQFRFCKINNPADKKRRPSYLRVETASEA